MKRVFRVLFGNALVLLLLAVPGLYAQGQAIGFIESFALAEDRAEALETLIPGSADYYYYHILHYQNNRQLDRVDPLMAIWRERHRGDARIDIMRNRQAVLLYDTNPAQSFDRLRAILQLTFGHQRDRLDQRTMHATRLDPAQINRAAFFSHAMRQYSNSVRGFEPTAFEWLLGETLNGYQRRELLGRLTRPDYPDLVALVAADLGWERSTGFGQHPVHGMLTLAQLEDLRSRLPALLNHDGYIRTVLRKLRPGPETDIEFDRVARRAWLDRLWTFVRELPDGQNALKAHVLYHLLELDRREEHISVERFNTYVRLPRFLPYVNEDWVRPLQQRNAVLNLNADYREATGLPPVGNDEPLVRAILLHLGREAEQFDAYAPYIRERYLREVLAEAKLLAGIGDPERWYSLLTPAQVQALRDRIDIDFAPTNPEVVQPGDPVTLAVDVKHAGDLMARVYRINALNVYRTLGREIDTGLDLDGLEANFTRTFDTRHPPLRRVRHDLAFPEIREPGVYVIDLIGNGRSSRALLRVGGLTYTMHHGPAGHVFRLYDEATRPVTDGALHLGSRRYEADAEGRITVPYSSDPGRRAIVLEQGGRVALDHFQHAAETYDLRLGAYVEREALIAHETAELILRPVLRLNGARLPLGLLEDVRLTLVSTDLDGISSTQVIEPFALDDSAEAVQPFRVPPRLRRLDVTLDARIRPTSGDEAQPLAAAQALAVNAIAATTRIAMPLLTRDGPDVVLEVRGRNGEPLAGHGVSLRVKHRDFTVSRTFSLQTGADGRIHLGALADIALIGATTAQGASRDWALEVEAYSYPATLTARAGQAVSVPWPAAAGRLGRATAGLLQQVDGSFTVDRFEALALRDGSLEISGLEPGDYQLVLKRDERRVAIHISAGAARPGTLLSPVRSLDATNVRLMRLGAVEADGEHLQVRLADASPSARVHLVATHYAGAFNAFEALHVGGRPDVRVTHQPRHGAVYLSGRDIGDEYRYVLDRRDAPRYPGNLLTRPGLLLNPWSLRETQTGVQVAAAGEAFESRKRAVARREEAMQRFGGAAAPEPPFEDLADVDFLAQPALVLSNLRPDADGVVRIARDELGARGWVRVIAVDGDTTAVGESALPYRESDRRERRLVRALDPAGHVVQRRAIVVREPGEGLRFDDPTDANLEVYDSLAAVFRLFTTLAAENKLEEAAKLAEFRFLTEWPGLDDATRRERYSRYASHELHLFLYRRDREFFDAVVRPYLANKKDKTFMDEYLLGRDLSRWRERWRFAQLNTVERILLGRRIEDAAAVARHVADRQGLLPPDIEGDNRRFDIALQGGALDAKSVVNAFTVRTETMAIGGIYASRSPGVRGAAMGAPVADRPQESAMLMRAVTPPAAAPAPAMEGMLADSSVAFDTVAELEEAVAARREVRALYQDVAPTREWAENNYYQVPIAGQNAERVKVNRFWRDYAAHDPSTPFRSPHFVQAAGNLTEMLLALAVLDLPFEGGGHTFTRDEARVEWVAGSPAIVVSRRIETVAAPDSERPILVGQNVFKDSERTQRIDNETVDRFITGGYVIDTVYGLRLVLTNPTSTPQRLDVLGQIPEGAVAVGGHRATTGRHVRLDPFESASVEILFYFPAPGHYAHFPMHVARDGTLAAAAEPILFEVVAEPPGPDTTSWDYISQHGTLAEVLAFLDAHNVEELNLSRIAWRMRERAAFDALIARLDARHVYEETLWSYGLLHETPPEARAYLESSGFAARCGAALHTALLRVDPVLRRQYQHLEYEPLVNARAHALGAERRIVNDALRRQYQGLLDILAHRARIGDDDRMAVVYYLLVQDRIEEALEHFQRVVPDALESRLQFDAFDAHLAFFTGALDQARAIAQRHADHPVTRWRQRFRDVLAHLDMIAGSDRAIAAARDEDDTDRARRQDRLAATDPALELDVTDGRVTIGYANLDSVRLNLYRMDIELLFSGEPFVQDYGERFAFVEPGRSEVISLAPDARTHALALPAELRQHNLLVEVRGAGLQRSQVHFPNALDVRVIETYGQLTVTGREDAVPQGGTYVKVYARMADGSVRFHKDGYTDLRGRFDYATVSGPQGSGGIERFSLLVLSDTHGALIREAPPPRR